MSTVFIMQTRPLYRGGGVWRHAPQGNFEKMVHLGTFKNILLSKNGYNLTVNEMFLKSINFIVQDKFSLFCKYIIVVGFFQQVKNSENLRIIRNSSHHLMLCYSKTIWSLQCNLMRLFCIRVIFCYLSHFLFLCVGLIDVKCHRFVHKLLFR